MSEFIFCPKCESENYVKNGVLRGKKRYKCKNCGCQFTRSSKHGKPRVVKMFALMLYISDLSMTRTAKMFVRISRVVYTS